MPDGCISSIDFDLNGNAWVLFQKPNFQFDLFVFDGKIWTSLLNIIPDSYSYPPKITIDQQGHAWVGTHDGISIYNGKTWKQYTKFNSGLSDNNINNIVFDKQGKAWITTRNEISVATPNEFVGIPQFFVSPISGWYLPGLLFFIWITINPITDPHKRKLINKLKESTISKSERYKLGFLSGGILSFLSLALIPSIDYGSFIISPFILIQALILGILSGFGGLIIGSIWQKKIGAVVGGLIAVIVSTPLLLWFSSCAFLGGC